MSTHGPHNGNGQSLDKGLEEIGRAYQGLEREQAPELLDQAILNKARREVEARPRWTQFGWLHGLTTAAVFVLAFSLVLNQRETAPVEETIELDSSLPILQVTPVAEDAVQAPAPAERTEYRSLQRTAVTPAADTAAADPDEHAEPIAGSVQRQQAQKSARAAAKESREPQLISHEVISVEEVTLEESGPGEESIVVTGSRIEAEAPPMEAMRKRELEDQAVIDDAEQRLAEIIRLKQAGDESWRAELEAFVEQYPDYPLPAELGD